MGCNYLGTKAVGALAQSVPARERSPVSLCITDEVSADDKKTEPYCTSCFLVSLSSHFMVSFKFETGFVVQIVHSIVFNCCCLLLTVQ